jgi:hypothetical protein
MLLFYLYSISFISLTVLYFSGLAAADGLAGWLIGGERLDANPLSGALGFLVISAPIWRLHWRRLLKFSERFSDNVLNSHRFYLFTVVCLTVIAMLISGGGAFTRMFQLLFGAGGDPARQWSALAANLLALGLSSGIWMAHWRQFRLNSEEKWMELSGVGQEGKAAAKGA